MRQCILVHPQLLELDYPNHQLSENRLKQVYNFHGAVRTLCVIYFLCGSLIWLSELFYFNLGTEGVWISKDATSKDAL